MINRLFLKIKSVFNKTIKLFSYAVYNHKRGQNNTNKTIVLFDTDGLTINRRLAQVVLQFYENNYDCRIRISCKDYLSTSEGDYSNIVFDHTRPIGRDHYELLVCGKNNSDHSCKRLVFNDTLISFSDFIESPFFYPLIFHPLKIVNHAEKYIENLYCKEKGNKIGVIFIGNTSVSSYQPFENIIHNEYGMLTRLDVLEYIKDRFPERVFEPQTKEEFYSVYDDPSNILKDKIVIVDRFRISGNEYFDILYNSIYHLWTCGDAFPYCHNQIEGMACGCIPIFEPYKDKPLYNNLDDNNSILFHNLSELDSIVQELFNNSTRKTESLSQAIRQLYIENFSLAAFKNKVDYFVDSTCNEEKYYIHPPIYKSSN